LRLVKLVQELELPELTTEQLETLCLTADNAAKKYVLSRVSPKSLERLNVSVEVEGSKPLNLSIDVDLALLVEVKGVDEKTSPTNPLKRRLESPKIT
jgi:hypothetical protein